MGVSFWFEIFAIKVVKAIDITLNVATFVVYTIYAT